MKNFRTLFLFTLLGLGFSGRAWSGSGDPAAMAVAGAGQPRTVGEGDAAVALQWIPAGDFTMGDAEFSPVRHVTLTRGFWLGRYEVTQAQWLKVMGFNPSKFHHVGKNGRVENAPVETVSWEEAKAFCAKLNEQEQKAGRLPAGYEYRLPTEAEWEYACRAGTTGDHGGNGVLDDMGWHYGWDGGNSDLHTHAVGLKLANAWGLYDMHGNVNEWCEDWYAPYVASAITDPRGAATGQDRVIRGGSWQNLFSDNRSAFRNGLGPKERVFNVGFRLALAPRRTAAP